ncbi:MmcQ/YjbR family DNA-binding protein [Jiangella alkaliphila]|uniref:Predicted DNA-binding protein, MmcQ/YjbR family n=1 Tax=Jiangella alkaliphila TaxID=419479 RepID=A0A1H2J0D8_9ACTN|nr:MmcQ/YjbR family DNA-binding protein [Jiangella alkaliphila]SDU49626.1 Predicted DNA-binding protein, MmcQ/YjbR family [Jiangella alkaliphila]
MVYHDDDVPDEIVEPLREICMSLPDAYEELAWVGTRWRVRGRTFAHVLTVDPEYHAVYTAVSGADRPVPLLTFRAPPEDLHALVSSGPPFFRGRWGRDVVVLVLSDGDNDWSEIAELVTESYCVLAPKKLVALVRNTT